MTVPNNLEVTHRNIESSWTTPTTQAQALVLHITDTVTGWRGSIRQDIGYTRPTKNHAGEHCMELVIGHGDTTHIYYSHEQLTEMMFNLVDYGTPMKRKVVRQ